MENLRLILGDQLSNDISSLKGLNRAEDLVLMCEVGEEATYVRHHKQKLAFIFSAMRHFAASLEQAGILLEYTKINSPDNRGSLSAEISRAVKQYRCKNLIVTEPGEWRVLAMINSWPQRFNIRVEIRPDTRFLCSIDQFRQWAASQKQLRMENFYRYMRRQTGWLMDNGKPEGGKWNYDHSNRHSLPDRVALPTRQTEIPDSITRDVITSVKAMFADHPGDIDQFNWAVTRRQAKAVLTTFIETGLDNFGAYQDAMKTGEDFLFHALLSPYINIGLLQPREVCEAVIKAGEHRGIAISNIEGFIRQVLGWREFVRGIYWLKMPGYDRSNTFDARRALPGFFWTADTRMFCLHESIKATLKNAYAHHIQRLMVIGNFSLLTGLNPRQVGQWYLSVYADAFEWVELPNTHGMALYADEGLLASKPYLSSGAYINRMSDYCRHCHYSVKEKTGKKACPFNYLYWYFLDKNKQRLDSNPRLAMPYRNLAKMSREKRELMNDNAEAFLASLR